jgi:hypothetical protein
VLSPSYLCECLSYSPETGGLTWRVRPRAHFTTDKAWKIYNVLFSGKAVNKLDSRGYRIVRLTADGKRYRMRAHRVIFALQTGEWPAADVDHKSRIRVDNRWSNLRPATRAENVENTLQDHNSTGMPGIWWCARQRKWWAKIQAKGRRRHLGSFATAGEAHACYLKAKAELHLFSWEASSG